MLSDLSAETTIAEVKRALAAALHLSNRKKTTLRWYGAALEDEQATLQDLHIPNAAQLEAVCMAAVRKCNRVRWSLALRSSTELQ